MAIANKQIYRVTEKELLTHDLLRRYLNRDYKTPTIDAINSLGIHLTRKTERDKNVYYLTIPLGVELPIRLNNPIPVKTVAYPFKEMFGTDDIDISYDRIEINLNGRGEFCTNFESLEETPIKGRYDTIDHGSISVGIDCLTKAIADRLSPDLHEYLLRILKNKEARNITGVSVESKWDTDKPYEDNWEKLKKEILKEIENDVPRFKFS